MIKKISVLILKSFIVLAFVWLLFSWVHIVADNNTAAPEHSTYNIFSVLEGVTNN
jgi:hypothetical protein